MTCVFLVTTSWFKMNDPNVLRYGSSRRGRDIYVLRFCTRVLYAPDTLLPNVFLLSSDIWPLMFVGYFSFEESQIPAKKMTSLTSQHGLTEYVCENSGSISRNGVNIWAFVRKICVICVVAL